jgi:hypothetical protein
VVLYFLQMAIVAAPKGYRTLSGRAATVVGQVANSEQLAGGNGGVCLAQGMTMIDQLVWHLFAPLMPMLALAMVVFVLWMRRACFCGHCACKRGTKSSRARARALYTHRTAGSTGWLKGGGRSRPLLGCTEVEEMEENEEGGHLDTSSIDSSTASAGVAGGVACLMLLSFSVISNATLKLLNCERVGNDRVLFYAGATKCGPWQLLVYLLLLMLLLVPLAPVVVQLLCLLPPSWSMAKWARTKHWPQHSVMQAIRRHATEPFEHEQRHWAAVLMLQRLLTVACHALSSSELQSALGVAIVSVWFLLLQALVRPYRKRWVNRLQLLSGWCLVMLTVLNSASSSVFVSVGVNVQRTPFAGLERGADWLMFLLLWPPVVMLLLCTSGLAKQSSCRCCKPRRGGSSKEGTAEWSSPGENGSELSAMGSRASGDGTEHFSAGEGGELVAIRRQHEAEKEEDRCRHEQEKGQLQREKGQLQRENQTIKRKQEQLETEQLRWEKGQLAARLEARS